MTIELLCSAREAELSLLAQGLGLMDGGVELDCFTDDRRSYTLKVSQSIMLEITLQEVEKGRKRNEHMERSKAKREKYRDLVVVQTLHDTIRIHRHIEMIERERARQRE